MENLLSIIESTDAVILALGPGEDRSELIRQRQTMINALYSTSIEVQDPVDAPRENVIETREIVHLQDAPIEKRPPKKKSKKKSPVIEEIKSLKSGDSVSAGDRVRFYQKTNDQTFSWCDELDEKIGEYVDIIDTIHLSDGIWINVMFDDKRTYLIPFDCLRYL